MGYILCFVEIDLYVFFFLSIEVILELIFIYCTEVTGLDSLI